MRVTLPVFGKRLRQQVMAGYGASGESQFTYHIGRVAIHRTTRLGGEVEDATGIPMKLATGVTQFNPAAVTAEERSSQENFQLLDALTHRGLRHAEMSCGGSEAAILCGDRECDQMGK